MALKKDMGLNIFSCLKAIENSDILVSSELSCYLSISNEKVFEITNFAFAHFSEILHTCGFIFENFMSYFTAQRSH